MAATKALTVPMEQQSTGPWHEGIGTRYSNGVLYSQAPVPWDHLPEVTARIILAYGSNFAGAAPATPAPAAAAPPATTPPKPARRPMPAAQRRKLSLAAKARAAANAAEKTTAAKATGRKTSHKKRTSHKKAPEEIGMGAGV